MNKLTQQAGAQIRAGYYDQDAFRQKEKLLLVLKTGIAGIRYHVDMDSEEGLAIRKKLIPGAELMLYRDADNKHDKWAISVYTKDDEMIGYVTRFKNETIARLMDLGKRFIAYVDDPNADNEEADERSRAGTEDYDVPFSVFMEEA